MHPRIHVLQGEAAICSPIKKESTNNSLPPSIKFGTIYDLRQCCLDTWHIIRGIWEPAAQTPGTCWEQQQFWRWQHRDWLLEVGGLGCVAVAMKTEDYLQPLQGSRLKGWRERDIKTAGEFCWDLFVPQYIYSEVYGLYTFILQVLSLYIIYIIGPHFCICETLCS